MVFWKVAMTRGRNNRGCGQGGSGTVTWPVRSCTQSHSKAKAAWASGVAVVFWKVAMTRVHATWVVVRAGQVCEYLARPLLCTSMMLPGASMVKWNISKRSHHVNEPMCD